MTKKHHDDEDEVEAVEDESIEAERDDEQIESDAAESSDADSVEDAAEASDVIGATTTSHGVFVADGPSA